jgi:23S rRNA (cytosine1962-C5)-methyltransferase
MNVVAEAAHDARRTLRLLEKRGQAKDHPMVISVPETGYLKCLIFYVSY